MITLLLGGVRSGKSRRALALAARARGPVWFLATARRSDAEMRRRIAAHRRERPAGWRTVEEPVRVPEALARMPRGATVVLDCVTVWIGGLVWRRVPAEAVLDRVRAVCATAKARRLRLIVVSNEAGSGVIAATRAGRAFAVALGSANQVLARAAGRVEWLVAGIPVAVKRAR